MPIRPDTYRCPHCQSINCNLMAFGYPGSDLFEYQAFRARLTFIENFELFRTDTGWAETVVSDETPDEFYDWFSPSRGRGVIPPGNVYELMGCVISDVPVDAEGRPRETLHCRDCDGDSPWIEVYDDLEHLSFLDDLEDDAGGLSEDGE